MRIDSLRFTRNGGKESAEVIDLRWMKRKFYRFKTFNSRMAIMLWQRSVSWSNDGNRLHPGGPSGVKLGRYEGGTHTFL